MTLYRIIHGRERPFDQTPEDRARESSKLKACGVVVAIMAGLVTFVLGMVRLPHEVSTGVAAAVRTEMDQIYVTKIEYEKAHKDLADAAKKSDDDNREQILKEMLALEGRITHQFDAVGLRLDTIRSDTSYVNGILRGEKQPSYKPLPRNQ